MHARTEEKREWWCFGHLVVLVARGDKAGTGRRASSRVTHTRARVAIHVNCLGDFDIWAEYFVFAVASEFNNGARSAGLMSQLQAKILECRVPTVGEARSAQNRTAPGYFLQISRCGRLVPFFLSDGVACAPVHSRALRDG